MLVFGLMNGTAYSFGVSEDRRAMVQVARQILSGGLASLDQNAPNSRQPASIDEMNPIGKIGEDAWGRPYHYQLYEQDTGPAIVVIWSLGPNGENELQEKDIIRSADGRPFRVISRGDDLAHIERTE